MHRGRGVNLHDPRDQDWGDPDKPLPPPDPWASYEWVEQVYCLLFAALVCWLFFGLFGALVAALIYLMLLALRR